MKGWLQQQKPVTMVYTDGSYMHRPSRAGGWAALIVFQGHVTELSGSEGNTTNNRMEMMGAIKALQSIATGAHVYVFTDSQYLKKGISLWISAWKRRNWMTLGNLPIANQDLWKILDAENDRHMVSWHWVRGHDGDAYNERCDKLASEAANSLKTRYLLESVKGELPV